MIVLNLALSLIAIYICAVILTIAFVHMDELIARPCGNLSMFGVDIFIAGLIYVSSSVAVYYWLYATARMWLDYII